MTRRILVSLLIGSIASLSAGCWPLCAGDQATGPTQKLDWRRVTFEPGGTRKEGHIIITYRATLPSTHADGVAAAELARQAITDILTALVHEDVVSDQDKEQFGKLCKALRFKAQRYQKKVEYGNGDNPANMIVWLAGVMEVMRDDLDAPQSLLRAAIQDDNNPWRKALQAIQTYTFDRTQIEPLLDADPKVHALQDGLRQQAAVSLVPRAKKKPSRSPVAPTQASDNDSAPATSPALQLPASVTPLAKSPKKKATTNYRLIRNWVLGVVGGVLAIDVALNRSNSLLGKAGRLSSKAAKVLWRFIFGAPAPEPATDELTAEECAELAGALMEQHELVDEMPVLDEDPSVVNEPDHSDE